jgi:hypothetical protein
LLCSVISLEATAYGAKGQLRLQLGGPNQWVYVDTSGAEQASEGIAIQSGRDAFVKQCQYSTTGPADLAKLTAIPAAGVSPNLPDSYPIGLGPDSIGVYDNSKGVGCYRMTASLDEGLRFEFGNSISGVGGLVGPGVIFDRLELDMEVKQDAQFRVTVWKDATTSVNYFLRSGSAITSAGTTGESDPAHPIFNCTAASDSGADSGPNDNCRWVINDFGVRFDLKAVGTGEGSLEGGGDFPDHYPNNSVIHLASLSETGDLTCDASAPPSGDNITGLVGAGTSALCRVTRIDPTNLGYPEYCDKPFPYLLSTFLTEAACEFENRNPAPPSGSNPPLAASVEVQFPPEARTSLDDALVLRTQVQFTYYSAPCSQTADETGTPGICLTRPFTPDRCQGTVVRDSNTNRTILEPLGWTSDDTVDDGPPPWSPQIVDQAPSVAAPAGPLDWACILTTTIEYIGDDEQQRTDVVSFWGDARFSAGTD